MRGKRLLQTLKLCTISSGAQRAEYLRENNVFASMGKNCTWMDRKVPLYAKLIRIGDNVHFASDVTLVTHDITHKMLNGSGELKEKYDADRFNEKVGCIDIGSNVFIGSGVTVLYDVKIGDNVIIAAGAVVSKDIPSGTVAGGVPARKICSFDEYLDNRNEACQNDVMASRQTLPPETVAMLWESFENERTDSLSE